MRNMGVTVMAKDQGKGSRKRGRNKERCKRYRDAGRRELNKAKRLKKHMKAHSEDGSAKTALYKLVRARPSLKKAINIA